MPRFFVDSVAEDTLLLTGQNGIHVRRSLRMGPGDPLTVCDGRGTDAACRIEGFRGDEVLLTVLSRTPTATEPSCAVTLYQGLPKGDKMEWIIQKAVELGVSRIVPVQMARSVSVITDKPDKRDKKAARWQKIADEAAGQSGRGILPPVEAPVSFREAAARLAEENTLICYEGGGAPLWELADRTAGAVSLVIGPEGGIDRKELSLMCENGGRPVTLGPRILRCETAPLAALAVLMAATGNM